jgi:hypothetical protein
LNAPAQAKEFADLFEFAVLKNEAADYCTTADKPVGGLGAVVPLN